MSLVINTVYMHAQPQEVYAVRRGRVTVVRTRLPIAGADLYAYHGAFNVLAATRGVPAVLLNNEPPVVLPGEFTAGVWGRFDHVFSHLSRLGEAGDKFHRWRDPAYHFEHPRETIATVDKLRETYPQGNRLCDVVMVLGDKSSDVAGEIYSLRREVAEWFHAESWLHLDVFGVPPFEGLANYYGSLSPDIFKPTISQYRFNVCWENMYCRFWTPGMLSKRLIYCLETRTVPVYLGCADIEEHVPMECMVDCRAFKTYSELEARLSSMTEVEYAATIDAIDTWLAEGHLREFSAHRLYEALVARAAGPDGFELFDDEPEWRMVGFDDSGWRHMRGADLEQPWGWAELASMDPHQAYVDTWYAVIAANPAAQLPTPTMPGQYPIGK